jgi:hypothetical protein
MAICASLHVSFQREYPAHCSPTRVYEFQSFLIALVQSFKFDLPDNAPKIRLVPSLSPSNIVSHCYVSRTFAMAVMITQVEGDPKHTSMPLKITALKEKIFLM